MHSTNSHDMRLLASMFDDISDLDLGLRCNTSNVCHNLYHVLKV